MKTHRLLGSILAGATLIAACNHDGASSSSGATDPASCTENGPGGRVLRRLSRAEYDATIHDLLGIDSTYGASFTPDIVVNGFDNNASALVVTPLLADQIRKAAEAVAAEVMKSPGKVVPCDPATGDDACAQKLVDTLGKRAFRRPLTSKERAAFLGLHGDIAATDGFATGVETVIAAILQSPGFLYRTEIGDDIDGSSANSVKLTPYEVATELSYFLWGTMPDDALFAAVGSPGTELEFAL